MNSSSKIAIAPTGLHSIENEDPWAYYEALREQGPLVWDPTVNAWLVVDFDVTVDIEKDERRFRHPYADATPLLKEIKGGEGNITLTHVPEEHAQLRRFHIRLLSPEAVKDYRERFLAPIIDHLVEAMLAKGSADLAADFGDQIPPRLTAALLGMDWRDDALIARILHLHEVIMEWVGRQNAGEPWTSNALAASHELNDILRPYVRRFREEDADNFIRRVWTESPTEFSEMTEDIVIAICRELFLGGSDTTVHGLANVFYLYLTRDDLRAQIAEDSGCLRPFVEEAMRLYGSVQYRYRVANQDCVLGGTEVRKDQLLVLLHAAGNRDPEQFGCPAQVDLTRKPVTGHLAFHKGPRACVGAGLARAEMRDAMEAIIARMPNVAFDPEAPQPEYKGLFMRSWRPLNVRF